jgi:ubiquinone/menaquinone biosynthesis C-methylase UbiE
MMKRRPIAELLDTDSGTPEQIAASLSDLQRINRWFGGISTARALVERVAERTRSSRLSLLEIASGAGYVPRTVHERLRKAGIELDVTLLDRSSSHLDHFARSVAGDVLALPFRDESFDLVSSTLFIHHLPPEQVVRSVREALRVCRKAVLINDVTRSRLHLWMVYAGLPLFRSRITWHDAPASVIQAYTSEEMRAMLEDIPGTRVEICGRYLFRMGVTVWRNPQ